MEKKRSVAGTVILTGASFAGYNIGSGFATGVEALQFFGAWGAKLAFLGVLIAAVFAALLLIAIYVTGYEQKFEDSSGVYRYFCGRRLGVVFDYYVYINMICITLTLMSGAGATIQQYSGLPAIVGAAGMGVLCIITALLDLERLRGVLSYMCIFIVASILICGVYALVTSDVGPFAGAANIERYVEEGRILRANAFGIRDPYLSGVESAALVVGSGFAWASATGALCGSRKEAVASGILSSVFYYATTAVVVYLALVSMDFVVGKEVPMLAVVQYFLPAFSAVYSFIIILAIFSTVSGRLFLIAKRYDGGSRRRNIAIIVGITAAAILGAAYIPFSRIANIIYSIMGAVGMILGIFVLVKFIRVRRAGSSVPGLPRS